MTSIVQHVPAASPLLTGRTVVDVMATAPRTMQPIATVADVRAFFEDDRVHMALIATSGVLLGTLVRADLTDLGDDAAPALSRSRLDGRLVAGNEPAEEVRIRMINRGHADIAARAAERAAGRSRSG